MIVIQWGRIGWVIAMLWPSMFRQSSSLSNLSSSLIEPIKVPLHPHHNLTFRPLDSHQFKESGHHPSKESLLTMNQRKRLL